jgi:hypothetical protein
VPDPHVMTALQIIRWTRWAIMAACLTASGCALNDMRGPGYVGEDWARGLRPPDQTRGEPFGFSTKAREIESNLGVE